MIKLAGMTENLYRHPDAVTPAILKVESDLVKIHRAMKDLALAKDPAEYDIQAKKIAGYEEKI